MPSGGKMSGSPRPIARPRRAHRPGAPRPAASAAKGSGAWMTGWTSMPESRLALPLSDTTSGRVHARGRLQSAIAHSGLMDGLVKLTSPFEHIVASAS
eukprot:scaffold123923_cov32-Tisochrysis_lutea.AAC.2